MVLSGKGGTGKTTIATSFALLGHEKVVVDADVDAPDMHLILKPKALEVHTFYGHKVAVIDDNLCSGCGVCKELCRFGAISESLRVDEVLCEGCALCYFACPERAVSMVEKESGVWFVAQSRAGLMLHARLYPGEENSGKLITTMRNRAKELARECGVELILIDGPPGIGCPVISSATGVTDVVLVVEPTLSGMHDAKRVSELVKPFGPRMWVVINRFDIDLSLTEEIEEWAKSEGFRLLGRCPVDLSVPELQRKGKAPVESGTLTGEMMREMWEILMEEV